MNNIATPIESLFEKVEDYSRTSIELFKLNTIDKSADLVSSLATKTVIFIFVAMFILSINIGLALWLGEVLGKSYYGFFVVGGIYALIAIPVYVFRHQWIKEPVNNAVITKMMQGESA